MCGAVWIDIGEFPQTVRRVARCDQTTFEVFQRFPFRIQGVGITDVEVHTRGRAEGIVLGPLGEVDGLPKLLVSAGRASGFRMAARRLLVGCR
jgi:hypothetical protein